uniref:Uncharacterized protein n=1 Tax=Mycena chlorophos TaxID=658473 RepID=A0ABQ0LVY6_MYCCL|nr:predicted protein [Mycena chlorophos]
MSVVVERGSVPQPPGGSGSPHSGPTTQILTLPPASDSAEWAQISAGWQKVAPGEPLPATPEPYSQTVSFVYEFDPNFTLLRIATEQGATTFSEEAPSATTTSTQRQTSAETSPEGSSSITETQHTLALTTQGGASSLAGGGRSNSPFSPTNGSPQSPSSTPAGVGGMSVQTSSAAPQPLASSDTSSSSSTTPPPKSDFSKHKNHAVAIAVSVCIVVLLLLGVAFVLYRRHRRTRDRRAWERTHAEIADAVQELGGPARMSGLWRRLGRGVKWNRFSSMGGHSTNASVAPLFEPERMISEKAGGVGPAGVDPEKSVAMRYGLGQSFNVSSATAFADASANSSARSSLSVN